MSEPRSDTWMPLYIGDYLAATQRLTTEQHGAYFLLLMDYWRNGSPPNDDKILAQIVHLSLISWRKMKPVILAYFVEKNGVLIHRRAERERARAGEIVEKRREAGRASAAARAAKQTGQQKGNTRSTHVATNGQHNGQHSGRPSQSQEEFPLDKESNGTFDPEKVMFDQGIRLLGAAGKSETQARGILGKWKRDHGAGLVIEAMGKAQREGAIEPVSFVERCLRNVAQDQRPERPIC